MELKVKEYVPKVKRGIYRFISKKRAHILLFCLAGVLFIAAAAVFISQWLEGETAGNNAQILLGQTRTQQPGVSSSSAAEVLAPAVVSGAYVQPEAPDAGNEDEINKLLKGLDGITVIGRIDIESLKIHLPVLSATSVKALKVSVCYYSGPMPDKDGNLVITGHNYRSGAHFGTLDKIKDGDKVTITDEQGKAYGYTVYKKEIINPDQAEKLDNTQYPKELTLVTCESNGNRRLVVRCKADGD